MKADLKAKWIAALRSGDYLQERSVLRGECGYCCLGVLCEVEGRPYSQRYGGYEFEADDWGDPVIADAELTSTCERQHGIADVTNALMYMNDGDPDKGVAPKTFAEIADWIETNIPAEGDAA